MKNKRFAIMGAAGYIAPRHMKAIKEVGGELVCVLDPNDSIGIIDSFFPKAKYFRELERFDREIDRQGRMDNPIDYVVICSPNYLHDSHIRFALKNGCDVICEKPLVLNPHSIDFVQGLERETGKTVYGILQLRLHTEILKLKKSLKKSNYDVELTYITPRGNWFDYSWKGDTTKSGGIATNIGIHFFDMLLHLFGDVQSNYVDYHNEKSAKGFLKLENAKVKWFLSVDHSNLPYDEWKPFRSIKINGKEIDFSEGFTELHTKSYEQILLGNGFGIVDCLPSLGLVSDIRNYKR